MKFWRICRRPYVASAFSGEGAKLAGGRWNTPGTAIAYTSQHLSLAAIELFVHIGRERPRDLVAVQAELPLDKEIEAGRKDISAALPDGWKFSQAITRRVGDKWSKSRSSVATSVPSAVIDVEWNILLNPAHPDFSKLRILRTIDFVFDERMYKGNEPLV